MFRLLSHAGIILALLSWGWCGALAAAVCGHPGCQSPGAEREHAPSHEEAGASPAHHSMTDEASGGHAHGAAAHTETGSVETSAPDFRPSHDMTCGHCMGRRESPTTGHERRASQPQGDCRGDAPRAYQAAALPPATFTQEVIPSQGAPPGAGVPRHLLLSVFRI